MSEVTIHSDFGAQKIKSDTVSTVSPSISHEVMGPDAMILVLGYMTTIYLIQLDGSSIVSTDRTETQTGTYKRKRDRVIRKNEEC